NEERGRPASAAGAPAMSWCAGGSGLHQHVDDLAAPAAAELDFATGQGEQGVVPATADVAARVEPGATLADDDLTGLHGLASEALHTQPLGVGVAAVPGGARALLGCHSEPAFYVW